MKKIVVVALAVLNVALLAVLMFGSAASPARAQVIGGGTDYILVTGRVNRYNEAPYVIDIGRQRMVAFRIDPESRRLTMFQRGRQLDKDFETQAPSLLPGR